MKTIVITIQDDVCAKNGRDPNATALIEAARNFGKVESWESAISTVAAQYQQTIDNLRIQLDACSEHGVTPAELEILRLIRKKSQDEAAHYEKTLAERDQQLKSIQVEQESRISQIKSILGV